MQGSKNSLLREGRWFSATRLVVLVVGGLYFGTDAAAQEYDQVEITVDNARIRVEPTTQSGTVGSASRGSRLPVLATVPGEGRDWYRIRTSDGTVGYIRSDLGAFIPASRGARREPPPAEREPDPPPTPQPTPDRAPAPPPSSAGDGPGQFGVGLSLGFPAGVAPMVLYDLDERWTLQGSIGFYSFVTMLGGEVYHGWPQPAAPGSAVRFEPMIGGGVHMLSIRFVGVAGSTVMGFSVGGGAYMRINNHPEWRMLGMLRLVQFGVRDFFEEVPLRGVGITLSGGYFF